MAAYPRLKAGEYARRIFSFREFLRHRGKEIEDPGRATKAERSVLRKELETYLAVGGFPEVQGAAERDRVELLRGYVDATLLRDVIERHQVSHPLALRQLARHLLARACGLFSVNRFYKDLRSRGERVAKDSLHAYLGHLEDAFLPGGAVELIQVCAEAGEAPTLEREVRALQAAAREHPDAVCSLLTLVPEGVRSVPATIQVHDASLWLLRRDRAVGAPSGNAWRSF